MKRFKELPSLEEIDRRIGEAVKDIEQARANGHGMALDQYEADLIFLIDMKLEKQNQMTREMIEGVPV